jgi:hypothetical protein
MTSVFEPDHFNNEARGTRGDSETLQTSKRWTAVERNSVLRVVGLPCFTCCPPVIDWLPLFSLVVLKHIFGIRFKLVMTSTDIGKARNVVHNESLKNYIFVVSLNFKLITRTIVTFETKNVSP